MNTASSHQQNAQFSSSRTVSCAILTVSDSRTSATDKGGPLIEQHLTKAGHVVTNSQIVPDEPHVILDVLETWLGDSMIKAILTTGGTGIAKRDTTVEVVRRLLTIELDGFGELFRMLSYEQVSSAAMLSRAVAGLVVREPDKGGDTFIFTMPGSPNAVELAMAKLIVPQLPHLVWERQR